MTLDERDHLLHLAGYQAPSRGLRSDHVSPALDCQVLTADKQTERLVVFTAPPGSEAADRLRLLSVVGNAAFTS